MSKIKDLLSYYSPAILIAVFVCLLVAVGPSRNPDAIATEIERVSEELVSPNPAIVELQGPDGWSTTWVDVRDLTHIYTYTRGSEKDEVYVISLGLGAPNTEMTFNSKFHANVALKKITTAWYKN